MDHFTKGKLILINSPKAAGGGGTRCHARNNDGVEVSFTLMHDEATFGPWRESYFWPDATVVGYLDNPVFQVTTDPASK